MAAAFRRAGMFLSSQGNTWTSTPVSRASGNPGRGNFRGRRTGRRPVPRTAKAGALHAPVPAKPHAYTQLWREFLDSPNYGDVFGSANEKAHPFREAVLQEEPAHLKGIGLFQIQGEFEAGSPARPCQDLGQGDDAIRDMVSTLSRWFSWKTGGGCAR